MNDLDKRLRPAGLLLVALLTACTLAQSASEAPPAVSVEPSATAVAAIEATTAASLTPTIGPLIARVETGADVLAEERARAGLSTLSSPSAAPSAAPSVETVVASIPPPASVEPFAINLFEEGDFVPQHTFEWCVAASIQMAHNLVRPDIRADPTDQGQLWQMARERSSNSFNGANPRGWAAVLNEIGLGPYELVSVADYAEALRTAASAVRTTGRPVGLVMWSGRHAWVMSGFESMGDPAVVPDFTVTGVRVLDPLYPYGSAMWGPSPAPNSLLSPAELAAQFVIREPRRWSSDLAPGYLLVLPTPSQ